MALVFLFVACLGVASILEINQKQKQREKEEELLFIGNEFRTAILSYYNTLPQSGTRQLPHSLDELVNDNRFASPKHHLRRIYVDPMTGNAEWTLLRNAMGIYGVSSMSTDMPIKLAGFAKDIAHFEGASSYAMWTFQVRLP